MVPCSLQLVYAKKYVKWKQEGYIDLWKQSWNVRKRLDYIRQNSSPYQLTVLRKHWLDGAVFSPASVRENAWSMKVETDKSVTPVIYVRSGFTNCVAQRYGGNP